MSERAERVALNEATSRELNEKIEQAHPRSPDEYFRIVCECGRGDCTRLIAISVPEYEAVRSDSRHFVVLRAHVLPDVEAVVQETDRYTVVSKHEGTPAEIVREEDPRS